MTDGKIMPREPMELHPRKNPDTVLFYLYFLLCFPCTHEKGEEL